MSVGTEPLDITSNSCVDAWVSYVLSSKEVNLKMYHLLVVRLCFIVFT